MQLRWEQKLASILQWPSYLKFKSALRDIQGAQRKRFQKVFESPLTKLLHRVEPKSLDAYKQEFPFTDYSYYENKFDFLRKSNAQIVKRWEYTSGSTYARKSFPYSKFFLEELDSAFSPWYVDLCRAYPSILSGRQYWALSWVPPELRATVQNNDLELFPLWKQWILRRTLVQDTKLSHCESWNHWLFRTAEMLKSAKDLSLISIWSPTFLLRLLDVLRDHHNIQDFEKLWPRLKVVSCWDSGNSLSFSRELAAQLPFVQIQGKGLWSTEGVLSIPFEGRYVPAINSHFYEFRCIESKKTYFTWELEKGQLVEAILTTSGGLLRYTTNDLLKVDSIDNFNVPNLKFVGRMNSLDLVGEKLSELSQLEIINQLRREFDRDILSFIVFKDEKPLRYKLLVGPGENDYLLEKRLDEMLQNHYHYKQARDLGQLGSSQLIVSKNPRKHYEELFSKQKTMLYGQMKIQALLIENRYDIN